MPKGAKERGDRNALGAMQHVSFAVSPAKPAQIPQRLDAHRVPYDGPLEILPGIFSIYVFDPNDIRLEFSCQPSSGEGEPCIVPQVTQTKAEALKELRSRRCDEQWLAAVTAGAGGSDGGLLCGSSYSEEPGIKISQHGEARVWIEAVLGWLRRLPEFAPGSALGAAVVVSAQFKAKALIRTLPCTDFHSTTRSTQGARFGC